MQTALIAGATGATAKRLVELLAARADWRVIGLCRNPPAAAPGGHLTYARADLGDETVTRRALDAVGGVSHVFYCCRAKHGESGVEDVAGNVAMLRNVVDAAGASGALSHVHLVEGGKWYGMHLGAFPTPARESDPRHLPPNFYYDQEDWLATRQAGQSWTWSASRPNFITDFAPERARNLVAVIGAYAALCKESGTRLDFPGSPAAFEALCEVTDATHLAEAILHLATTPAAANQAFNVTNGQPTRWSRLWPLIAAFYDLEPGIVRPLRLAAWMADKQPAWDRMTAAHGLVAQPLDQVANWAFADFALNQGHDVFYDLSRLRAVGFANHVDTAERLIAQLIAYRKARILP